jgi:hypothetical protein
MKPTIKPSILTAVALTLLAAGSTSANAEHSYRFHDKGAIASFESVDTTGCIVTGVFVQGSESYERIHPDPATSLYSVANVVISVFNQCTGLPLLEASGVAQIDDPEADDEFLVGVNLKQARLMIVTLPMVDALTNEGITVRVDLTWEESGQRVNDADFTRQRETSGMLFLSHFKGDYRPAVATGTVTATGTRNYTPPGNLTPQPSIEAQITKATQHDITVTPSSTQPGQ